MNTDTASNEPGGAGIGIGAPENKVVPTLFRDRVFDIDYAVGNSRYWLTTALIIAFGLWHIATNLYLTEPGSWQNCIHFGGFAFLAAISSPLFRFEKDREWAIGLDVLYGLLVFSSACWIAYAEDGVYARTLAKTGQTWQLTFFDWAAGLIVIFAAIDLTRRLTGWIIPVLIIVAMSYILFLGEVLPGAFRAASLPLSDVLFRSMYNDEGMFGVITTISSATLATTPRSWVIISTAMSSSDWRSAISLRICAWMVTSSAVVGSSAMSTSGPQASAMAIMARWRMPPEISWG